MKEPCKKWPSMMTIAKKSLPLSLGKGRIPAYGLQATLPKADETVKSTPNRDKFNQVNSHQG